MTKGTTGTGFKYSFDEKLLQSMRFLDLLVATEKRGFEGVAALSNLTEMMLGKDKEKLYEHLEKLSDDNIATLAAVRKELVDMINGVGAEGKN